MKPWKQALLIGGLGVFGALAGLGLATVAFGPGTLMGTPAGQWVMRHVFDYRPTLADGRAVIVLDEAVPALALHDVAGAPVTLTPGGRPLLINYWASWCSPCVEEMPLLDAFSAAQGDTGVQVIGIALDDADEVAAFLRTHPVHFPIRIEASGPGDSSMLLGNARSVLPYSVLIDARGRLSKTRLGAFREGELESWALD